MQPTPSFYWHDYETFGLNRRTDRPVQFAGLRTTLDFEPQGEVDVWYAKPALDYLPQPESCLITGITPQQALQKGLPEAQFACKIYEQFNTPGTIVVGYNNLRFDDEVTRAMFWRNLYDMYAHQYKNGCSRWDLFPFVLAVWALRDEGINFGHGGFGEISRAQSAAAVALGAGTQKQGSCDGNARKRPPLPLGDKHGRSKGWFFAVSHAGCRQSRQPQ